MGTLRGDNGGGQPPNGGGLPDLPPEWGVVIIPDDAAELDVEAAQVHRELRWYARGIRWRRRFHLPVPVRRSPDGTASRAAPASPNAPLERCSHVLPRPEVEQMRSLLNGVQGTALWHSPPGAQSA